MEAVALRGVGEWGTGGSTLKLPRKLQPGGSTYLRNSWGATHSQTWKQKQTGGVNTQDTVPECRKLSFSLRPVYGVARSRSNARIIDTIWHFCSLRTLLSSLSPPNGAKQYALQTTPPSILDKPRGKPPLHKWKPANRTLET